MRWHRLASLFAVVATVAAGVAAARGEQYIAITFPVNDVTINFTRPGRILELPVKENERVTKGQVLARLDDTEEQAALAQDQAKAEDSTRLEAQKTIKAHEEAKFKKLEWAHSRGVVSEFELNEAKVAVKVEDAKIKLAEFERRTDDLKLQQTRAVVNKMTIKSPIDGRVEKQFAKLGESVEPSTRVVRIIDLSKLYVETPVPFEQAVKLKEGDVGRVHFSDKTTADGKVIFLAGMADAGANTLLVRIEIENNWQRRAGERVKVEFPTGPGVAKQ